MKDIIKHIFFGTPSRLKRSIVLGKKFLSRLFTHLDPKLKEQLILVLFLVLLLIPGEIIYKSVVTKSYQFNDTEANTSRNADKVYPQYVEDISHSALYYFSQSAMASDNDLSEIELSPIVTENSNFVVYDGGFLDNSVSTSGTASDYKLTRNQIMSYTVQDGDTPGKIASEFGISTNTIIWANNLKNGNLIKPGQDLVILPVSGVQYTVKSGDTLSKVASTYKVDAEKIKEFNNLPGDALAKGDVLIIPDGKMTTVASAAKSGATTTASNNKGTEITNADMANAKGYFIFPTTGLNWGVLHPYNAVDIANHCGTPVYAAADGIVTVITNDNGWNSGYGNHIRIQHPNGSLTLYAHLSVVNVKVGQSVTQGQVIGAIGNTGNVTGPTGCHLHFEVRGMVNPFAK